MGTPMGTWEHQKNMGTPMGMLQGHPWGHGNTTRTPWGHNGEAHGDVGPQQEHHVDMRKTEGCGDTLGDMETP